MERVGVEAVVAGLSSFLGDMKKMDSAISGLVPGTKLLENAFGFLGDTLDGFINFTLNALAHALGELIADAIEFVVQKIGELVEATIEVGAEFQTLELRLQTLNFNSLTESGMEYNEATTEAIRLTKEQLDWLQKLAVTTPYDAADIANVFTLARSYGFVDDEARTLTESISNFAAGMGLGNTEIERIIVNFGQMVQQGKVTQREMNDLARGAFVPVNDVLALMQKNLGMSSDELTEFRKTGEGVDAFMQAFIQLVEQRFAGSAEKMARTFQGATANLQDLVKSIGGMNIVKPILDVIGGRIADFLEKLTEEDRWESLTRAAKRVGTVLSTLLNTLLQFLPGADSVADGVVKGLNGIADWINKHRDDITTWIIESSRWINNVLIPDIKNVLKWLFGTEEEDGAIQKFGKWIEEKFIPAMERAVEWGKNVLIPFLQDDLGPVFESLIPLAEAIGDVLITAFGGEPDQEFTDWIHEELIPGIEKFTQWIEDNKEEIALWINRLVVATIQLAIFVAFVTLAINVIGAISAAFLDWLIVSGNWIKIAYVVAIVLALMALSANGLLIPLLAIVGIIAAVAASLLILKFVITASIASFLVFIDEWVAGWGRLLQVAKETIDEVFRKIKEGDWAGAGRALVEGIGRGFETGWNNFISMITRLAQSAAASFANTFNFNLGELLNIGPATAGGGAGVATGGSSVPQRSQTSNLTNNNSYNLTINSSAQTENVVQDFNLLQSLGGR